MLEDVTKQRTTAVDGASWCLSPGTIFGGLLETDDSNHIDDQPDAFNIFGGAPYSEEEPSCSDTPQPNHSSQDSLGERVADTSPNDNNKKSPIGTDAGLCCPMDILAGRIGKPEEDVDNRKNIPGTHVETCGPMDILGGRAGKPKDDMLGKSHPGTRIFNDYIAANLHAYRGRTNRMSRSLLIKDVVDQLLSRGCRFLKFDSKVDSFVVLDEKQIRDKVSFALRHKRNKQDLTACCTKKKRTNDRNKETQAVVKRETNHCSPRSSTNATSVTARNSNHFLCKPSDQSVSSTKSSIPPNHCCFLFNNTAEQPLVFSQYTTGEDDGDEREFIEKIEELDADCLSLNEEEDESTALDNIGDEPLGYALNPFLQSSEGWVVNMTTLESDL